MLCTTRVSPSRAKPQQSCELWPGGVPAGGLVCEDPVHNLAFELAFPLVQRAHANVADPLSSQRAPIVILSG
jgi:hypothetical protein